MKSSRNFAKYATAVEGDVAKKYFMQRNLSFKNSKKGVTNLAFAGTVIVLVVIAGIGFGLYGLSSLSKATTTSEMNETNTMMSETSTSMSGSTRSSYNLTPASGAMINNAWLLSVPLGNGNEYAVSIHAEGLETNGSYIVEGNLSSGGMSSVPISQESMTMQNDTGASEFQANANGTGLFWIVLNSNPATTFENIKLYLIPTGMTMQDAMLVATASFSAMTH